MLLSYKFAIEGPEKVIQAIESVESRYVRSAKATEKASSVKVSSQKQVNSLKSKEIKDEEMLSKLTEMRWKDELKGIKRAEQERIRSSQRAAKEEARDRIKAEREVEREAKRTDRARQKFASGIVGTAGGSVRGTVGLGMRVAGSIGGIVGGLAVGDSIARAVDDQKRVRALVIQGNHGLNDTQVNTAVTGEAIGTGQDKGELLSGLAKFVGVNGDIKLAVDALHVMNTAAIATGASMDDIAEASAQAFAHGHIKDAKELGDLLAVWAEQGKKGTFELKNLSGLMGRIGALYENMGLGSTEGLKVAGGISQIIRGSVGGPEQAITAQEAFKAQIIKHSKDLESGKAFSGSKFQIFSDKGKTSIRDIRQLIPDILRQSGGNQVMLQKNLSSEGMAFIQPFQALFSKVMNETKGTKGQKREAGAAAVTNLLNSSIDAGGVDFKQLEKDSADAQQTLATDMAKARNDFDQEITKNLIPALTQLIPKIKELIPYVGKAAEMFVKLVTDFSEHPLAGVMSIIGAKMVADVGQAAIGKVVGEALVKVIAGSTASTVASSLGGGLAGEAAALAGGASLGALPILAIAGLTVATITVGSLLVDHADMKNPDKQKRDTITNDDKPRITSGLQNNSAVNSLDDLYSGKLDSKDPIAKSRKQDAKLEAYVTGEANKLAAIQMQDAAKIQLMAANALKDAATRPLPTGRDPGDPH